MREVTDDELKDICEIHKGWDKEDMPLAVIYARCLRDLRDEHRTLVEAVREYQYHLLADRKAVRIRVTIEERQMLVNNIKDAREALFALLPQDSEKDGE